MQQNIQRKNSQFSIEEDSSLASMIIIQFNLVKQKAKPRQQSVTSKFYKRIQNCSPNRIMKKKRAYNHMDKMIKKMIKKYCNHSIRQGEGETNIQLEEKSKLFAKYVQQVFQSNIENALKELAKTWHTIQQQKLKLLQQEDQQRLKLMPDLNYHQIKYNLQKIFKKQVDISKIIGLANQASFHLLEIQQTINQQQFIVEFQQRNETAQITQITQLDQQQNAIFLGENLFEINDGEVNMN